MSKRRERRVNQGLLSRKIGNKKRKSSRKEARDHPHQGSR
jgi:hypothetical protein